MARRSKPSKLTPEQIRATLFTTCTECGYQIQPSELRFVDGKRCRCPQCGADFEPETKSSAGGGTTQSDEPVLPRFIPLGTVAFRGLDGLMPEQPRHFLKAARPSPEGPWRTEPVPNLWLSKFPSDVMPTRDGVLGPMLPVR